MDLKCKNEMCINNYRVDVEGSGRGFVGLVVVVWKCNVCRRWNLYVKNVMGDVEVSF